MKFPLQTDSRYASIHGWGCLMMSYAWFIALEYDHDFSISEIEGLYLKAVENGIILDNSLSTDGRQGMWYRCFMHRPSEWIELVAESIGHKLVADETFRGPRILETAKYLIYENRAWYKKPCIHFTGTCGETDYNPDTRIEITGIKTVRGWELMEV
jgi:hypothetical protein